MVWGGGLDFGTCRCAVVGQARHTRGADRPRRPGRAIARKPKNPLSALPVTDVDHLELELGLDGPLRWSHARRAHCGCCCEHAPEAAGAGAPRSAAAAPVAAADALAAAATTTTRSVCVLSMNGGLSLGMRFINDWLTGSPSSGPRQRHCRRPHPRRRRRARAAVRRPRLCRPAGIRPCTTTARKPVPALATRARTTPKSSA